jgi:hypothetical protein
MNTDEFIALLADGGGRVDPASAPRRLAMALTCGLLAAGALMQVRYGVRPSLLQDAALGMFWVKFAFVAATAGVGLALALRLSHPGAALGRLPLMLTAPAALLWLLAFAALVDAAPQERAALLLGQTWEACPFRIALLSVPAFAALVWGLRAYAPTRLRLTGAVAGLCAGAFGALAYTLHCPELAAPFLGLWYVAGMLIPAAAGALLGPLLLRW